MPLVLLLACFGAVLVLPAVAFEVYLLTRYADLDRQRMDTLFSATADSYAANLDRELSNSITVLRVLSSSDLLLAGMLEEFHARASAAMVGTDSYVLLLDTEGQQLLNTRVPFGAELGRTSDPGTVTRTADRLGPYISNVFFGRVADKHVFNVAYPVVIEGELTYILVLTRNSIDVAGWLGSDETIGNATIWITDADGTVLTHRPYDEALVGQPLPVDAITRLEEGDMTFTSRLRLANWTVIIDVPTEQIEAASGSAWTLLAVGALLLLLLTAALAFLVGRGLASPIHRLARDARSFAEGKELVVRETPVREINEVSRSLNQAGNERAQRVAHVELLMRELAHRAKNQLSIVQALAGLIARRVTTIDAFRTSFIPRLEGLGRSIDAIIGEEWKGARLDQLLSLHLGAFADGTTSRYRLDGPAVLVRPAAAERLGLAVHELATNATKYGAWSVPTGLVTIVWRLEESSEGEMITITWTESGGPPVGEVADSGFGRILVQDMMKSSLDAEVSVDYRRHGLVWTLRCPTEQLCAPASSSPPMR